jgi:hypothetical protein
MRPLRFLLAGSVTALLLLPTAALAQAPRAELRDMSCTGIQAAGTDMPKRATLRLTLVDTDDHATLARQDVVTSAAGTFETTVNAQLNQVAGVHMTVQGPGGEVLAFADPRHGRDDADVRPALHRGRWDDPTPVQRGRARDARRSGPLARRLATPPSSARQAAGVT